MTAYLQPGDKIHISIPNSMTTDRVSREIVDKYREMGVSVFMVTQLDPDAEVEVVSVIRSAEHQ